MMAVRSTRRRVLVVDEAVNPIWRSMLEAYVSSLDLEIKTVSQQNGCSDMDALMAATDATCAAVIVQNPNFFGAVADYTALFAKARSNKAFGVISVYPVMPAIDGVTLHHKGLNFLRPDLMLDFVSISERPMNPSITRENGIPSYWMGISHPAKGAIFAPCASCQAVRGVRRSDMESP